MKELFQTAETILSSVVVDYNYSGGRLTQAEVTAQKKINAISTELRELIDNDSTNDSTKIFTEQKYNSFLNKIRGVAQLSDPTWFGASKEVPPFCKDHLPKIVKQLEDAKQTYLKEAEAQKKDHPQDKIDLTSIQKQLDKLSAEVKSTKDTLQKTQEELEESKLQIVTINKEKSQVADIVFSVENFMDLLSPPQRTLLLSALNIENPEEYANLCRSKDPVPARPLPDKYEDRCSKAPENDAEKKEWLKNTDNAKGYDAWKLHKALPNTLFAAVCDLVDRYNEVLKQMAETTASSSSTLFAQNKSSLLQEVLFLKNMIYELLKLSLVDTEEYEKKSWSKKTTELTKNEQIDNLSRPTQALIEQIPTLNYSKYSDKLPSRKLEERAAFLARPAYTGLFIPKDEEKMDEINRIAKQNNLKMESTA